MRIGLFESSIVTVCVGLGYSMSEPPMSPNSRHQHLRQMVTKHVEQIIGGQIDMVSAQFC